MRKGLIFLLVGFSILLLIVAFEGYYNYMIKTIPTEDVESVIFVVEKGESLNQIASKLKEDNFITSDFIFLTFLKRENLDTKIQAGEHTLTRSMTMLEVADNLKQAYEKQQTVKILEGWRLSEIADYLEGEGIFSTTDFYECLKDCDFNYDFITKKVKENNYEGYLFPDTYKIAVDSDPKQLIGKMLDNFSKKIESLKRRDDNEYNEFHEFVDKHSLYEIIIVASMIEREVRTDSDRAIVSGIIWNRLKKGMGLGIDATLLYALDDWDAILTTSILSMESPYNTRKKVGLPPTPICQPSLNSLRAAFNPEDSDYLYYLTPDSGEVIYGRTLDEHNVNKRKYLN